MGWHAMILAIHTCMHAIIGLGEFCSGSLTHLHTSTPMTHMLTHSHTHTYIIYTSLAIIILIILLWYMQVSICLHMCTQSCVYVCVCVYMHHRLQSVWQCTGCRKRLWHWSTLWKRKQKRSSLFPCKSVVFYDVIPTALAYLAAGDARLTLKVA